MDPARQQMTEAEYLAFDAASPERNEFYNGEVVAMAGAEPVHGAVTVELTVLLRQRLGGRPCLVWSESLRVRIGETGAYVYPDIAITCGRPELADTRPRTLLNPLVVVEVLSDSTESHDRGAKFAHYQRRASLREYVLVSTGQRRIEHYQRIDEGGWHYREYTGDDVLALPALGVEIPLADIYAQADLLAQLLADP